MTHYKIFKTIDVSDKKLKIKLASVGLFNTMISKWYYYIISYTGIHCTKSFNLTTHLAVDSGEIYMVGCNDMKKNFIAEIECNGVEFDSREDANDFIDEYITKHNLLKL